MHSDEITGEIIRAAVTIHREFGPGLMESVYEAVLAHSLVQRGVSIRRQQAVRFEYCGMQFEEAFRADLLVNDTVVIELKSVARNDPVFARQLLTYLRLLRLPVGLVINFGQSTLLAGVKRVVNDQSGFRASRVRINSSESPHSVTTARRHDMGNDTSRQPETALPRDSAPPRENC
jgi:GxxExxY protein